MATIGKHTAQIYLIRHAQPDLSRSGLFSHEEAARYIHHYDLADIVSNLSLPDVSRLEHVKKIYCSPLNRAIQTAKALFGPEAALVIDKRFREFERKIARLPLLKLPIDAWLVGSRLLWFAGFNNRDIENFNQARSRAKDCARFLANQAEAEQTAVLVAHGMFNRFIRRYLRQQGWQLKQHQGNGFLAFSLMEKQVS
jgi:broad specificity phosphatase PhoE